MAISSLEKHRLLNNRHRFDASYVVDYCRRETRLIAALYAELHAASNWHPRPRGALQGIHRLCRLARGFRRFQRMGR